jgi:hypothetical protein
MMAVELVLDDPATALLTETPDDGLLVYLGTLARFARAPVASHWCTPGHNRGAALTTPATMLPRRSTGQAVWEGNDDRHAAR